MIITIHGEDSFRSRQELEKIIKRYRKKYIKGGDFKFFDDNSAGENLKNIKSFFTQSSMFKESKFAVAEECLSSFIKSAFWDNFKNEKNDLIVFFELKEIDKTKISLIEKYGKVYCFNFLTGAKLKSWVTKEFEKREGKINQAAILKLLELTGNDTWFISNEIDKLICFKKKEEIDITDVNTLVNSTIIENINIFKAVDFVVLGEKEKALSLMCKLLDDGNSVSYLFSMISSQFKNMIIAKTNYNNRTSKELGIHPYVFQKSIYQAARFSLEELKNSYSNIFKAELDVKVGRIDSETAIDLLLTTIK